MIDPEKPELKFARDRLNDMEGMQHHDPFLVGILAQSVSAILRHLEQEAAAKMEAAQNHQTTLSDDIAAQIQAGGWPKE